MIRRSVLPDSRDRLWPVFAARLDAIEHGLTLVLEGLDCSSGQHGVADGLARDGAGAPVLVLVATPGDSLLLPRVVSAAEFLGRVGDALVTAVPEGNFCRGTLARVLVVGTDAATTALHALVALGLPRVEVCRLEPFRLAGTERFAITWLTGDGATAVRSGEVAASGETAGSRARAAGERASGQPRSSTTSVEGERFEASLRADQRALWQVLVKICERLDDGVCIERDGLLRRITWQGRLLGRVASLDSTLRATAADGTEHTVLSKGDVRAFADRLMRRYAELAGLCAAVDTASTSAAARSADARSSSAGSSSAGSSNAAAIGAQASPGHSAGDHGATKGAAVVATDPQAELLAASPTDPISHPERAIRAAGDAGRPGDDNGRDRLRSSERSTLRAAVSEALLSPEEFAALAEPQQTADPQTGAPPPQPPD